MTAEERFRQMVTAAISSPDDLSRAGRDIFKITDAMTPRELADSLIAGVGAFCALMYRAYGVDGAPEAWAETCLLIESRPS